MAAPGQPLMEIEFQGGPVDGHHLAVPDGTKLWVVSMAPMSAAEFIAAQDRPDLIAFATMTSRDFAYEDSKRISQAGYRMFRYMGERVMK